MCDIQNADRVVITDDGFVCIFEDNDDQVIRILNTIFVSARLLLGIHGDIVRIGELCPFK
jgi:hypothetical protein